MPELKTMKIFCDNIRQKKYLISYHIISYLDCTLDLESRALVSRHVSDPSSSTNLTLELNILNFVLRERALAF